MPSQAPAPATAETGYITQPSALENTYTSDKSLQRSLGCKLSERTVHLFPNSDKPSGYLPPTTFRSIEPQLVDLGAEAVSEKIREWSADAEKNQPYVKSFNVWGKRYDYDRLITTEGWKQLGNWGARRRIVSAGYDKTFGSQRRTVQYALYGPDQKSRSILKSLQY